MGQGDVLAWLEAHEGWHRAEEISEGIDVAIFSLQRLLRKLKKNREIEVQITKPTGLVLYRHLKPRPRGRPGRSVENRVGQAWRSGSVDVIGEDMFGNVKIFHMSAGHFQCKHCLAVVRIDERGFAACGNCGLIYNDGKVDEKISNRERKRRLEKFKYDSCHRRQ